MVSSTWIISAFTKQNIEPLVFPVNVREGDVGPKLQRSLEGVKALKVLRILQQKMDPKMNDGNEAERKRAAKDRGKIENTESV